VNRAPDLQVSTQHDSTVPTSLLWTDVSML